MAGAAEASGSSNAQSGQVDTRISGSGGRGLLDIKVTLSNPAPTAGSEFTVYVLVTNLFDVPIWPESPQVFLPSELKTVSHAKSAEESVKALEVLLNEAIEGEVPQGHRWVLASHWPFIRRQAIPDVQDSIKYLASQIKTLDEKLSELDTSRGEVEARIEAATQGKTLQEKLDLYKSDENLKQQLELVSQLAKRAEEIRERLAMLRNSLVAITDGSAIIADGDLTLSNVTLPGSLYVQAKGDVHFESSLRTPVAVLDSSLRPGVDALQPGNTAVYSLALTTKSSLFFRPIQYMLQYSINFSFDQARSQTHTNSASQPLTIRAPITSVMTGAVIGGIVGYMASTLQTLSQAPVGQPLVGHWTPLLVTLAVTVILSAMAVVFLARKSETQSLVSIEDFWGGLVIGFLVGYTGTKAFESFAGISSLVKGAPTPAP